VAYADGIRSEASTVLQQTRHLLTGQRTRNIEREIHQWGSRLYKHGDDDRVWAFPDADVFRMDDGFPSELDKARLSMMGDSVYPAVAELIALALLNYDDSNR
jgi:site-specific DNA-cytosine methylase